MSSSNSNSNNNNKEVSLPPIPWADYKALLDLSADYQQRVQQNQLTIGQGEYALKYRRAELSAEQVKSVEQVLAEQIKQSKDLDTMLRGITMQLLEMETLIRNVLVMREQLMLQQAEKLKQNMKQNLLKNEANSDLVQESKKQK